MSNQIHNKSNVPALRLKGKFANELSTQEVQHIADRVAVIDKQIKAEQKAASAYKLSLISLYHNAKLGDVEGIKRVLEDTDYTQVAKIDGGEQENINKLFLIASYCGNINVLKFLTSSNCFEKIRVLPELKKVQEQAMSFAISSGSTEVVDYLVDLQKLGDETKEFKFTSHSITNQIYNLCSYPNHKALKHLVLKYFNEKNSHNVKIINNCFLAACSTFDSHGQVSPKEQALDIIKFLVFESNVGVNLAKYKKKGFIKAVNNANPFIIEYFINSLSLRVDEKLMNTLLSISQSKDSSLDRKKAARDAISLIKSRTSIIQEKKKLSKNLKIKKSNNSSFISNDFVGNTGSMDIHASRPYKSKNKI